MIQTFTYQTIIARLVLPYENLRLSTLSKFIFEKIFTQYSFFVLKIVIFLSLCCMKYIIFLYINANKKLVLLSATTVLVKKRSSCEIIQFKN